MNSLERALWGVKEPALSYTKPKTPPEPRPVITAWKGADMDAYHLEAGRWIHCQTGEVWNA